MLKNPIHSEEVMAMNTYSPGNAVTSLNLILHSRLKKKE